MNRLFLILSTILFVVATMNVKAQENTKLSYQAVVRDNQNKLLANDYVNVEINILKPNLTVQYSEAFTAVPTNQNGLISLIIGNKPSWDNVVWSNAKLNVKITLPDGMGMVESTSEVSSVPLAINARYADSVNAEAIPQSNWDETNSLKSTFIKNKPNITDSVANYLTVNNYVTATAMDARAYLTSDSTVITTMQREIDTLQSTAHTHANKARLDTYTQTEADLADAVANKHSHENASVLAATTASFTIADENKLDSIAAGAEVNVNADWTAMNGDAQILNKPNITDSVASYLTANKYITKDSLCSSIKDNCTNVALKNEANTFSGNNAFTGTNDFTAGTTTVASGFTFGTTTAGNCNNVAVNACDLLVVFDSLVKRMKDVELNLYKKIDSLKNILDEPMPCMVARRNANEKGKGATGISSVQDHQGNWYKVVQIGTQCWMAENMRATTEPTEPDVSILQSMCSEKSETVPYAYYPLCNEDSFPKYGCLYNFPAVMNGHAPLSDNTKCRGICPEGWHVPTDAEWKTLEKCCLMEDDGTTPIKDQTLNDSGDGFRGKGAGKFTGGNDWKGNAGITAPGNYEYDERNITSFSVLPAGNNYSSILGYFTDFWSASSAGNFGEFVMIRYREFNYEEEGVKRNRCMKSVVYSLRCVRD